MTLLSSVGAIDETPVDRYRARQADPTAVERFARRHEADLVPRQARYYRDLIPLGGPQPGQQYRFAVDLDACTGCKACVAACHRLNGLDEGESWRSVTVLPNSRQTVTAACHHCADPACLNGCPVDAYEKDPVTGIVVHLDDQCIGCAYCTLTCPYDVPVYNAARGIVRKCDMCEGRLAAGEAPACVQGCPNAAITIELVDVADIDGEATIPGASAPSSITRPTTAYRTGRPSAVSAHVDPSPRPAPSHAPLALMLVLTQFAVGTVAADLLLGARIPRPLTAGVAFFAGVIGLAASVAHLGRPRYCYRAVIGLRHSWLSREVVAFGAFTGLGAPYTMALAWGRPVPLLGGAVALVGGVGVACSAMIYAATRRAAWRTPVVATKFALTTAAGGLATALWAAALAGAPLEHERALLVVVAVFVAAKQVVAARRASEVPLAIAGAALPVLLVLTYVTVVGITAVLAVVVACELRERMSFFVDVGGVR